MEKEKKEKIKPVDLIIQERLNTFLVYILLYWIHDWLGNLDLVNNYYDE